MATQQQVTQLYQELLGRAPDSGGLAYYMRYSDPGAIRSSILGSTEYKTRAATPPAPRANENALNEFASNFKTEQQALLDRQKAEQEGLFTGYEKIRNNQEALPAMYQRLQEEQGVPELGRQAQAFKTQIYATKDLLDRVGEDVTARTTGTLATDAQRRRLITSEQEPLNTQLARLGTGLAPIADMLSGAREEVGTLLGLNQQMQERELEPIKLRINAISDRFARELTGFTQQKEQTLTAIVSKLERDRQLDDRDWQLAQKLAEEERAFARSKASAYSALGTYAAGGGAGTSGSKSVPQVPQVTPTFTLGGKQYSFGSNPVNLDAAYASGGLR